MRRSPVLLLTALLAAVLLLAGCSGGDADSDASREAASAQDGDGQVVAASRQPAAAPAGPEQVVSGRSWRSVRHSYAPPS